MKIKIIHKAKKLQWNHCTLELRSVSAIKVGLPIKFLFKITQGNELETDALYFHEAFSYDGSHAIEKLIADQDDHIPGLETSIVVQSSNIPYNMKIAEFSIRGETIDKKPQMFLILETDKKVTQ